MDPYDRRGIAARLRELLWGTEAHEPTELGAVAQRLRVEEHELRISIDVESPRPTLEILAAIVHEYGVDPTWLLTGSYDTGTHRLAVADWANAAAALEAVVVDRITPASIPRLARSGPDRPAETAS